MDSNPKIIKASLISPLVVLFPIASIALLTIVGEALDMPSLASADDAPMRAAGIILFVIIPVCYPILSILMCIIGYILKKFSLLTRKNLFLICIIVSLLFGIRFGWPSPFGIKDQFIGVLVFFPLTLCSLLVGTFFWWKIAVLKDENKKARTVRTGVLGLTF